LKFQKYVVSIVQKQIQLSNNNSKVVGFTFWQLDTIQFRYPIKKSVFAI